MIWLLTEEEPACSTNHTPSTDNELIGVALKITLMQRELRAKIV